VINSDIKHLDVMVGREATGRLQSGDTPVTERIVDLRRNRRIGTPHGCAASASSHLGTKRDRIPAPGPSTRTAWRDVRWVGLGLTARATDRMDAAELGRRRRTR
jgi:hypothetical protein